MNAEKRMLKVMTIIANVGLVALGVGLMVTASTGLVIVGFLVLVAGLNGVGRGLLMR